MSGTSESGIIPGAMSNAALKFRDILMQRFDPRQEKPPSAKPESTPPEKIEPHRRETGLLPESFWDMPMPDDPDASIRAALIEERNGER